MSRYRTYKVLPGGFARPTTASTFESAEIDLIDGTNFTYAQASFSEDQATVPDPIHWIQFPVPTNYNAGKRKVRFRWKSTSNVGDVVWTLVYRAMTDGSTWDAALADTDAATSTAAAAAGDLKEVTIPVTGAAWTAGYMVELGLQRTNTDGADTHAAPAVLVDFDVLIEEDQGFVASSPSADGDIDDASGTLVIKSFLFSASSWGYAAGESIDFRALMMTDDAAATGTCILYNMTDAVVVATLTSSDASLTKQTVACAIVAGVAAAGQVSLDEKQYEVRISIAGGVPPNNVYVADAQLAGSR